MKLFFIKIGKALGILKRDGLFQGGGRVLKAFFTLFRRVGNGDILFVTGGVGDSTRFRAFNVAEELGIHGLKCSISVQDNPLLPSYADKFKIFIFHRVLFTRNVERLIENIKKQGKEIIFEIDDLVFDPEYLAHMDYFQKMNFLEKKLYENGVGSEILKDTYVKACTTTTSYLADKLRKYKKKVFIVPNKLSNKDIEIADKILKKQRPKAENQGLVKIGYFSGTISHNKDFATITDALMVIMKKYQQIKLILAGPLEIENKLNKFKDRIVHLPFASRKKHFKNIAGVDINLAPLEIGNPFCEAKSELKFFEAGILKVPTVAAATQTFKEAIKDGVDGFLANTSEEWIEKLEKLINDKGLRLAMGKLARNKALQRYANRNSNNEKYYNYLKSKL